MILSFTRPSLLFLLFIIPILVFFHIISMRGIRRKAIKFANFEAISRISGAEVFSKNITILYLNIMIVSLLIFSLSGLSLVSDVESSSYSFVIAIDSSGSMGLRDLQPTRLEAAKKVAIDLISTFPDKTKIGVVSFASVPVIMQALSEDQIKTKDSIRAIDLEGFSGTDIFNAIAASASLLAEEQNKMIILISDGSANINTVQQIIDYAHNNEIIINSLSIALPSNELTNLNDVETLKIIAKNTDGLFYEIKNTEDFYDSINKVNETISKSGIVDLSFYLLIASLVLFILSFILTNLKYRGLP